MHPENVKGPPTLSLVALFLRFLRFGSLAFGGPVAQIAMIRAALVDDEQWVDSLRFNRLLAVMQALPGPEAHELCVHLGIVARGRLGGLVAGLGFMFPGLALMMLAGWAYHGWLGGNPAIAPALLAIQLAVLAIIVRAIVRIGTHMVTDLLLAIIAVASFAAAWFHLPFWLPLVLGGLLYGWRDRLWFVGTVGLMTVALAMVLANLPAMPGDASAGVAEPGPLLLFIAGLKGGLLTFGGAYTAIPYVRADTVGRGWLTDSSFLDGVALAGVLPTPLVIFATFAGYLVGGPSGALAITAGMFLPAFAFSMLFFERLEAIIDHPPLQRMLAGVGASVVGTIVATVVQLGLSTSAHVHSPVVAITIATASAVAVWRLKGKWVTPVIVIVAGTAGWAIGTI